jgi:hypothetical protein
VVLIASDLSNPSNPSQNTANSPNSRAAQMKNSKSGRASFGDASRWKKWKASQWHGQAQDQLEYQTRVFAPDRPDCRRMVEGMMW